MHLLALSLGRLNEGRWDPEPLAKAALEASGEELDWMMAGPWALVMILFALAAAVAYFSGLRGSGRSPRGRRGRARRQDFSLEVARFERLPLKSIAESEAGPCHLQGKLVAMGESLGGPEGQERLFHDRAGGSGGTAVAVELALIEDASGSCALIGLEKARVIAPAESSDRGEYISLRAGQEVQVLGHLRREAKVDPGEKRPLLGAVGMDGPIQLRVLAAQSSEASSEPGQDPGD